MDPLYRQALLQGVVGLGVFVALVFGTAGTWDYWQGWVFLAVFAIGARIRWPEGGRHDDLIDDDVAAPAAG